MESNLLFVFLAALAGAAATGLVSHIHAHLQTKKNHKATLFQWHVLAELIIESNDDAANHSNWNKIKEAIRADEKFRIVVAFDNFTVDQFEKLDSDIGFYPRDVLRSITRLIQSERFVYAMVSDIESDKMEAMTTGQKIFLIDQLCSQIKESRDAAITLKYRLEGHI